MPQTRATTADEPAPQPHVRPRSDRESEARAAARSLATVLLVGIACGVVVVGVLSRLAMGLLAALNPEAAGVLSDDGFVIGQVTLSGSLQLAAAGAQFGALGAFFYLALRGLMVGPAWFRLLSMSVGPGVVVGAILVHTSGVDFTVLEPLWLTIGLFVLLPVVFCAALHVLAERALAAGGVRSKPLLVLGLLPAVVLFPLTLVLALGWLGVREVRAGGERTVTWSAWALRAALAGLFVVAVLDLVADGRTLAA